MQHPVPQIGQHTVLPKREHAQNIKPVFHFYRLLVKPIYYAIIIIIIITIIIIIIFNLRTAALKAYCAIWVRRSNFRHQVSPRVSPCESTQRRKVELWARNVR